MALGRLLGPDGPAVVPDLLVRRRATASQRGLTVAQRHDNVRGAFAVNARHRGRLAGARVVVVDDVYTTGATLGACSRALARAGAGEVDALTLARVVRPQYPGAGHTEN